MQDRRQSIHRLAAASATLVLAAALAGCASDGAPRATRQARGQAAGTPDATGIPPDGAAFSAAPQPIEPAPLPTLPPGTSTDPGTRYMPVTEPMGAVPVETPPLEAPGGGID